LMRTGMLAYTFFIISISNAMVCKFFLINYVKYPNRKQVMNPVKRWQKYEF